MAKIITENLQGLFRARINTIKGNLKLAAQEELGSDERNDIIANIAVALRTLFCTAASQPLIKSAKMEQDLYFPLQDNCAPDNLLSYFLLAGRKSIQDGKCCFEYQMPFKDKMVPRTIMSYKSWLSETVIDLKLQGFPPYTRRDVIRIVADRIGAHVDENLHPVMSEIEQANKWPLVVAIDLDGEKFDSGNLLYETVYAIAEEVVYAYRFLNKPKLYKRGPNEEFQLVIFDYSDEKNKRYKFGVNPRIFNVHNTTKHYPCNITKHDIQTYFLQFKNEAYPINLFRVEDYL